ncbi:MAG: methyl-accepting chemotaxis protein [Verrucomicrobiota bacterium]
MSLGVAQIVLMLALLRNQIEVETTQERQYFSWRLADELRTSSDELTRTARTYVVTGNRQYYDDYYTIARIRDGVEPRPNDGRIKPGLQIPLLELMAEEGLAERELALLSEAKENSDELINVEASAFDFVDQALEAAGGTFEPGANPMARAKQAYAMDLMYNQAYNEAKDSIMNPILEFEQLLDKRMLGEMEDYRRQGSWLLICSVVVAALLALVTLLSYYGAQKPAAQAIQHLATELEGLASGGADLKARLHVEREDEIGQLARNFNALLDNLGAMVDRVEESAAQVVRRGAEMLETIRGVEQNMANQSTSTTETTVTTRQISATAKELAETVARVAETAASTGSRASLGREGLERIQQSMGELLAANEQIVDRLSVINEKTSNIGGVVTTISKVAEQTNLLSLNAAIEAEKAGEYGLGFAVVAREIRRLADHTAEATRDIGNMIHEVESAVSSGVMEMDKFGGQVRTGAGDVQAVTGGISAMTQDVEALEPLLDSVRDGVKQQAEGASAIYEAMDSINEHMQKTTRDIEAAASNLSELESTGRSLHDMVARFSEDQAEASFQAVVNGEASGGEASESAEAERPENGQPTRT